jgi:hypothetical protein
MSDLAAARIHMELAAERLQGDDDLSRNARETLRSIVRDIDEVGRRENSPVARLQRILGYTRAL